MRLAHCCKSFPSTEKYQIYFLLFYFHCKPRDKTSILSLLNAGLFLIIIVVEIHMTLQQSCSVDAKITSILTNQNKPNTNFYCFPISVTFRFSWQAKLSIVDYPFHKIDWLFRFDGIKRDLVGMMIAFLIKFLLTFIHVHMFNKYLWAQD